MKTTAWRIDHDYSNYKYFASKVKNENSLEACAFPIISIFLVKRVDKLEIDTQDGRKNK